MTCCFKTQSLTCVSDFLSLDIKIKGPFQICKGKPMRAGREPEDRSQLELALQHLPWSTHSWSYRVACWTSFLKLEHHVMYLNDSSITAYNFLTKLMFTTSQPAGREHIDGTCLYELICRELSQSSQTEAHRTKSSLSHTQARQQKSQMPNELKLTKQMET